MNPGVGTTAGDVRFERIRKDFPVLEREVNGHPLVYLDNAASSQMPLQVSERLDRYHRNEHANVHRGIHTLSQEATEAYEETRMKVRDFIGAGSEEEIVFTTGTTDSINLVANSFGSLHFSDGDEILISEMEHHANIVPWQMIARRTGALIRVIPVNDLGEIDMEGYARLLGSRTRMVAVGHVSNALGSVNPVTEMTRMAHDAGAAILIDGAQAVPHQPVDVQETGCDFYAFSAHKMCGPTGIGVLYGKAERLEEMPPYRGGGDMIDRVRFERTTYNVAPYKFEAGTPPIAAGIGLGAAVDYLETIGMERIAEREGQLLDYALRKLKSIEGLRLIGEAPRRAAVISFLFGEFHPHDIGTILDKRGVAVRTGHHCAQPIMERFGISATARASFSFYNNEEDVDRLVDGLKYVETFFSES